MERKKKPNGLLISGLISALASLAIVAIAPGFAAGPSEKANDQASANSSKSSEDTKGNDRKSGYEDNSSTPQETNHGKGADNDGDAGNDSHAYNENDDSDGRNNVGQTPGGNESYPNASRHPSGKDRYEEKGGSGNQGRSESNPDDSKGPMRYEGSQGDDKPNGPGGNDIFDQDGNNGCGNDQDFDDDNNGWCGKPDRTKPNDVSKPRVCPDGSEMPANGRCEEVGGEIIERCPDGSAMPASGNIEDCVEVDENPSEPKTCPDGSEMPASGDIEDCETVLGENIDRDRQSAEPGPRVLGVRLSPALNEPVKVAGAVLPFTGGDMLLFLVLALALFGSGLVIMKATKIGSNRG